MSGAAPQRNRVTPLGDIVAIPLRGSWMGNRGILHRGTDLVSFHRSTLWITCALRHRDWRAPQWQPGHYTVLFFHDEAVALAAGHRPCALCRRAAYRAFRDAAHPVESDQPCSATQLDRLLHSQRIITGSHRRRLHQTIWPVLPDGVFVLDEDEPALVVQDAIVPWTHQGYRSPRRRPVRGTVTAITPPATQAALSAGYPVQIDGFVRELVS